MAGDPGFFTANANRFFASATSTGCVLYPSVVFHACLKLFRFSDWGSEDPRISSGYAIIWWALTMDPRYDTLHLHDKVITVVNFDAALLAVKSSENNSKLLRRIIRHVTRKKYRRCYKWMTERRLCETCALYTNCSVSDDNSCNY